MKKLFKIAIIMIVATTTMFATSCTNKEDDPNAITDANLVGEWIFTDNRQNPKMIINADHTCTIGNLSYNWALSGKTFKATQSNTSNVYEFEITELNGNTMKVVGSRVYFGTTSEYSGTLRRTTTETPTSLKESELLGSWEHFSPNDSYWSDFAFTLKADHVCDFMGSDGTWSVSGNTISMDYNDNIGYMNATVKTITTSATKVVMKVEGSRGSHQSWGDNDKPFMGTFVKNL